MLISFFLWTPCNEALDCGIRPALKLDFPYKDPYAYLEETSQKELHGTPVPTDSQRGNSKGLKNKQKDSNPNQQSK